MNLPPTMTTIPVDTDNFRVEIDDGGIAHLIFGPAGGMPVSWPLSPCSSSGLS